MLSLTTFLASSEIHGLSTVRYIEFCFLRLAGNHLRFYIELRLQEGLAAHVPQVSSIPPSIIRAGHDPLIWIKYIPGPA